jgi:hypothetical protein
MLASISIKCGKCQQRAGVAPLPRSLELLLAMAMNGSEGISNQAISSANTTPISTVSKAAPGNSSFLPHSTFSSGAAFHSVTSPTTSQRIWACQPCRTMLENIEKVDVMLEMLSYELKARWQHLLLQSGFQTAAEISEPFPSSSLADTSSINHTNQVIQSAEMLLNQLQQSLQLLHAPLGVTSSSSLPSVSSGPLASGSNSTQLLLPQPGSCCLNISLVDDF